jgi:hypothetical protein
MEKEVSNTLENKFALGALSKVDNIIKLGNVELERKLSPREEA